MDQLVPQALASHPTIDRALAVVAEARAQSRTSRGARLPTLSLDADMGRERTDSSTQPKANRGTASAGLSLAWEIDLFGRLRNASAASAHRLAGRLADAQAAELSLAAEAAGAVLALRACNQSVVVLESDIASRETILALTRQRRDAGLDADIDVRLSQTGLESARTAVALRRQDCAGLTSALAVLTGASHDAIGAVLAAAPIHPQSPRLPDAVPAMILMRNPSVAAAERNVAAAWADIAVARAERMPRLDLSAALTGQWLRALGATTESRLSIMGLGLTAPLFDGGRGVAAIEGAEARHAMAVADLDLALRTAAREVENALSASISARTRDVSAGNAVSAAGFTLRAREAQWRAGAVSQFEVEDARRQFAAAQDSLIAASRDAAQAWVALVLAAGPDILLQESAPE